MQTYDIKNISVNDPCWPKSFRYLKDVPRQLYIQGNINLLTTTKPCLGVVGTRKATPYGKQVTSNLVRPAAASGAVIVSGLAYGIDTVAHQATLDANGATIAVLPTDLRNISPAGNRNLAQSILDHDGLLISEYGPGQTAKYNFIKRNRLIAALCETLLVTEATHQSGVFHTVTYAKELHKTIAGVPGNIDSPQSEGVNQLLFDGAQIILNHHDLLTLLRLNEKSMKTFFQPQNPVQQSLFDLLKEQPANTNALIERSNYSAHIIQAELTILELNDAIEQTASSKWRLR